MSDASQHSGASGSIPRRKRIVWRIRRSGGEVHREYRDGFLAEDLPEYMRKGVAVEYLAQELNFSPATLYRHGIVARIPVVYLSTRKLRDGTEKPSEVRVRKGDLLWFIEQLVARFDRDWTGG